MFSVSKDRSDRGDRRLLQIRCASLQNCVQALARTRLAPAIAPVPQASPGIGLYGGFVTFEITGVFCASALWGLGKTENSAGGYTLGPLR